MNNQKSNQVWRIVLSISVIVLVLMLGTNTVAKELDEKPVPVTVQNDETAPIPVVIEQPSVTPQPVTVTGGQIIVANGGSAPIPVYDLSSITDYGEHIHFNFNITVPSGNSGYFPDQIFDIPDGYRLFIDYITVNADLPAGQRGYLQVATRTDYLEDSGVQHHFALTPMGESISTYQETHVLSEATKIFADAMPGWTQAELSVLFVRGTETVGDAHAVVSITGRLVQLD